MYDVLHMLFFAVGFNLIFTVLAVVALLIAKPGRKWVWALYGTGAGITLLAIIGSLKTSQTANIVISVILFVVLLVLFGTLIAKRVAE